MAEASLLVVTTGTNTWEELSATAVELRRKSLGNRVIIVSDSYHALRVELTAREAHLDPLVSPIDSAAGLRRMVRETLAVAAGRLVGFRRLQG